MDEYESEYEYYLATVTVAAKTTTFDFGQGGDRNFKTRHIDVPPGFELHSVVRVDDSTMDVVIMRRRQT